MTRLRLFRIDRDPYMTYSKWTPCGHGGQMVKTRKAGEMCVSCAKKFNLEYMYTSYDRIWRSPD